MERMYYPILLFMLLLLAACGRSEEPPMHLTAHIHGKISVDPELDSIRDYSGFELLITTSQPGIGADTLYHAVTDSAGEYGGNVRFYSSGLYTLLVSRHGQELAYSDLVLADRDTIRFEAEFPEVERTATIQSSENDLFNSYLRLQSGVNRIFQFAGAGYISGDTLEMELMKWSDMLWEFHEDHPETFAGRQSAASSIRLLEGWQENVMLQRLNLAVDRDSSFVPFASGIGLRYHADRSGLEGALAYLDTLKNRNPGDRIEMQLNMDRVKLLYDSSRVEQARLELDRFKDRFAGNQAADNWIERFEYDLTKLAPGSDLPEFEIVTSEGAVLSKESMKSSPYILEFTRLDNLLYQEQFERNVAIHHIYKNYGVNFITIAFEANQIVLDAFFDERTMLWPFAQPGSFDPDDLVDRFNINVVPTRILVDRMGRVVRKYEGTEYNDIIPGLRSVLNSNTLEDPS